jgi:hypothetical protein
MTPSAPSFASVAKSDGFPSTGVWSNLKSPVWTTAPTGVRIPSPMASGIEWPIRKGRIVKGPIWSSSPGSRGRSGLLWSRCSFTFVPRSPRARVEA